MARVEFEMIYRLRVRGPMDARLARRRAPLLGDERRGREGPRIKARIAMPGGDWYRPGADGFGRPDVRVQFITDDDAVILLHYTGLVQMNDAFTKSAKAGNATRFEDHYMRMAMCFDVGEPKYAWLNQHLFVAEGRLTGKDQIEYHVYRVT